MNEARTPAAPTRPCRTRPAPAARPRSVYSRFSVGPEHRRVVGVDGDKTAGGVHHRLDRVDVEPTRRPGWRCWRSGTPPGDGVFTEVGPAARVAGRRGAVADALRAQNTQRVPDRLRAGGLTGVRHAVQPGPARARSKYGRNCGRGTPISGPPSPKPISPRAAGQRRPSRVASAGRRPARQGCRRSSAAPRPAPLGRPCGRPRSPPCSASTGMPRGTELYRGTVSSA